LLGSVSLGGLSQPGLNRMVGHRLDLEAVGEAVFSKGLVCGRCHVDGFWFGH